MLYTSGTTGNPKGVPLTHRNTGVNGRDWLLCNGPLVEEDDVDLLWLPMSHIFGFGEACLGNTFGWTSYLCTPLDVVDRLPEVRPDGVSRRCFAGHCGHDAFAGPAADDGAGGQQKHVQGRPR